MSYSSWSVVFGEQPSAAKWNILGTNDSSFNDGTGIADGVIKPEHLKNGSSTLNTWVWDTWTPTLSGRFTDGDWTKSCRSTRIGDTVIAELHLVSADATPMAGGVAGATFTLPHTSVAYSGVSGTQWIGTVTLLDNSVNEYMGPVKWTGTTTGRIDSTSAAGTPLSTAVQITSTVPMTWGSGDEIHGFIVYQAAA